MSIMDVDFVLYADFISSPTILSPGQLQPRGSKTSNVIYGSCGYATAILGGLI